MPNLDLCKSMALPCCAHSLISSLSMMSLGIRLILANALPNVDAGTTRQAILSAENSDARLHVIMACLI